MSMVNGVAFLTLIPAYGTDYKTKKAVIEAWNADKDFLGIEYGQPERYINRSGCLRLFPKACLEMRYSNKTKVTVIQEGK